LTTLTEQHLGLNGHEVQLAFEAKGGAEHQVVFESRRLATLLARCQELRGQTLFSYEVDGDIGAIRSDDVNDYLTAAAGSGAQQRTCAPGGYHPRCATVGGGFRRGWEA
jgi:DNA topoisomerase-1